MDVTQLYFKGKARTFISRSENVIDYHVADDVRLFGHCPEELPVAVVVNDELQDMANWGAV